MVGIPAGIRELVRELPPRALAPLAGAIFLLFSTMGFLLDIMAGGTHPLPLLMSNVLFSGVIALVYASTVFSWWFLGAGLVVHLLYGAVVVRLIDASPIAPDVLRLNTDALGVIACMTASYTLFLIFVSNTGARYLKARAEIDLARQIHAVLVPRISARIGDYEFFGVSEASGDVGGDLVDLVALPRQSQPGWIGYIADVSGHGVSSGVLMGMAKSAAHMNLRGSGAQAPDRQGVIAAMLDDLNAVLHPLKQSSMFVTFACVADVGGDDLEFSVAGHLPILCISAAGQVREATTPQVPVGMFEERRFVSDRLTVPPGDLLVLITDGLTEVFDRQDEEFGLDRVKAFLAAHASRPLEEIARGLVAQVRAHGEQIDDQTILLVRRNR
jgi:serine phosphatase RsbU (regulator of sigma subunit)